MNYVVRKTKTSSARFLDDIISRKLKILKSKLNVNNYLKLIEEAKGREIIEKVRGHG